MVLLVRTWFFRAVPMADLHHLTREASGTSFGSSSAMKFASAASPG